MRNMKAAADRSSSDDAPRALPRRKPDVLCQRVGKDTLLYNPETDRVHLLNPTALAIWERCDGHGTAEDLAAHLAATFAGAADRDLIADVHAALTVLYAEGLLADA